MQVDEYLIERMWYDTTQFWFKIAMSAMAIAYTRSGFAIAADSRETSKAGPESEPSNDETSDTSQKIFEATAFGTTIAFGLTGFTGKGASYDLIGYAQGKAKALSSREFRNAYEYRDAFAQLLERYILNKKRMGIIQYRENPDLEPDDRTLIASLHIVGYCHGLPFWLNAKFDHEVDGGVSTRPGGPDIVPGLRTAWGSNILPALVLDGDPRFAQYRDRLATDLRNASLDAACGCLRAYIELCSDPLAAEIDPICRGIGGPPQIATITPEHGFDWVVRPITEDTR